MKKHVNPQLRSTFVQEIAYNFVGHDPQTNQMHTHDGYEILQIIGGTGNVVINDKIFNMDPGAVFIINGESFHCTHPQDESAYIRNTIQFSAYQIISMMKLFDLEELIDLYPSRKDQGHFILKEELSNQIHAMFLEMKQMNCSNQYGVNLLISYKIIQILLLLNENASHRTHEPQLGTAQSISLDIMQYVTEHIVDFSLDQLADALHMSKYYLCHSFKKATGLTINYYLMERRLAHAKTLLKQTNTPISQISMELGYSSFSLFCRTFKNLTGVPPREFRKNFYQSIDS